MQFQAPTTRLLAALLSAAHLLAEAIPNDQPTSTIDAATHMATPNAGALPDYLDNGNNIDNHLELRQAVDYATEVPAPTPVVTTFYMQKSVGTTVTYAAVVFTQHFSAVPDQLPSPGVGSIGFGNLVKQEKREAEAMATPAVPVALPSAEPLVLELHEVGVTQWIQPVTQVTELVISTIVPTISSAAEATLTGLSMATGILAAVASDQVLP